MLQSHSIVELKKRNEMQRVIGNCFWYFLLVISIYSIGYKATEARPISKGKAEKAVSTLLKIDEKPLGAALGTQIEQILEFEDDSQQPLYYAAGSWCYNYFTRWNGTTYVCGCVATAMSNLMGYHQHPTSGPVVAQHNISIEGGPAQLEPIYGGDGSGGAYSWSERDLVLDSSTGLIARAAIGYLAHDAGVSVNMDYDTESGTNTLGPSA